MSPANVRALGSGVLPKNTGTPGRLYFQIKKMRFSSLPSPERFGFFLDHKTLWPHHVYVFIQQQTLNAHCVPAPWEREMVQAQLQASFPRQAKHRPTKPGADGG